MVLQTCTFHGSPDADGGFHGSLADQTLWLISLRWVAVSLVVIGTLMGTYLFPMLMDPRPLYATATVLLACNLAYVIAAHSDRHSRQRSTATLAMVQMELDLLDRTEQVTTINEMLKMSQVRMAQREKMVALGQMAARIAHEIGNPLTSLSSVVQYLSRKCADPELKELCSVVDHHVGRISAILRRMLNHARPATSEYKWVNVNESVHDTLALIRLDKRAAGITITDVYNAELPMVWLDPQNLEECLFNIAINALDAMEAKGPGHDHRLDVTKTVKNEMVEIRIGDTGVGMNPETCRRAFESFFTTKEIGKGTGLGLFISSNLITEMDGTIELESEPSKGTTAIIRIPVRPRKDLLTGPACETDRSNHERQSE